MRRRPSGDILVGMHQPTPDEAVDSLIHMKDVLPGVFILVVGTLLVGIVARGYLWFVQKQHDILLKTAERALRIWREQLDKGRARDGRPPP